VTRTIIVMTVLALLAVAGGAAYQTAARQRDYRLLLARGDTALGDDQTFAAIEAYSGAIALRSDSMLAHHRLAETYQRRGNLDEAAREFRLAASLDSTATRPLEELGDVLYQQRRYARAADAYDRCLRLDDRSPRVSYKLALARYRDGNIASAMTALTDTIRLDDRMPHAQYLLGMCLRETHHVREARRALEKAVTLAPGSIPAREELADLYRAMNRRSDELEQLRSLAVLDRDHVERQIAIALAHVRAAAELNGPDRVRHADLAVLTLTSALERAPDEPLLYRALGQVWLERARDDPAFLRKAREALERVASSPSATSESLTLYGRALLDDGDLEAAERTLQQATTRFPVDPNAFVQYAGAAERQNHFDAARRALIEYNGLASDDGGFVSRATRIAALSLRVNDPATAVDWLKQAGFRNPNDLRLIAALADAQLRAGNRDAALETIARGLEKDPQSEVLLNLDRVARARRP
jgi:tetratricopeptide (TPR) repeat protein